MSDTSPWPAPYSSGEAGKADVAEFERQRLLVGGCSIPNGTSFDVVCSCGHLVGMHAAPMGVCMDCTRGDVCQVCGVSVSDSTRHAQWHIDLKV